jgi:hypothetical protein
MTRWLGLAAVLIAGVLCVGVINAQADSTCDPTDCPPGPVSTTELQLTFSTFAICRECGDQRGRSTAFIAGAHYPPGPPVFPPAPIRAFAQGRLLLDDGNGAEQIYAVGRIYQTDEGYVFDGHAVPNGPQHPPAPIFSALTFRGIIFSDGPASAGGR